MADASEYASRMVNALAMSEPELDTSIGSPTRKILDAVAEVAAEASADSHLLNYQFDVDSKSGDDLDDFTMIFGISRFPAQRAAGTIIFSRPSNAPADILIPANTQVVTGASPQVVFYTVAPGYLTLGTSSVDVPIQAVVGGESGNLAAGAITLLVTPLDGITATVTNPSATTGGANIESDSLLATRFKKTVLRSMAGTEDMFLGVALEASGADGERPTQAIVLGSSKRWREQVQVAAGSIATSTIPVGNVKYVFANSSIFGTGIDSGAILTPGVHYDFDTSVTPPRVVGLGTALVVGDLYDLDFEYSPKASRNDPANGITNRVDIWTNGLAPSTATESIFFRSTQVFTATPGNPLTITAFVRKDTPDTRPTSTNIFVQLAFGPITNFPATLTISGTTYVKGVDYWVVHDDTAFGYGPTSLFGLEWLSTRKPAENTAISLSGAAAYTFNRVPRDVEDRVRRWRLVTTDVRAHAAKRVNLVLNLAVMFNVAYNRTQVQSDISRAVTQFLEAKGFDAQVQISDLLQTVHNVQGVDNVRFLTSAEPITGGHYAIERVSDTGVFISYFATGSPARAPDINFGDNEVPVLYGINVAVKASNTFGVS